MMWVFITALLGVVLHMVWSHLSAYVCSSPCVGLWGGAVKTDGNKDLYVACFYVVTLILQKKYLVRNINYKQ